MKEAVEKIAMSLTMQSPEENGNLNWVVSLLNLAQHAAEEGQIEVVRTARELAERLRSVHSIYESDEIAREVEAGIEALRQALNSDPPKPLGDDPAMRDDLVEVTTSAMARIEQILDGAPAGADTSEILNAFRKVESLAMFLQLSALADLSRVGAELAAHPPSGELDAQVRQTSDEIRKVVKEIHVRRDGDN